MEGLDTYLSIRARTAARLRDGEVEPPSSVSDALAPNQPLLAPSDLKPALFVSHGVIGRRCGDHSRDVA